MAMSDQKQSSWVCAIVTPTGRKISGAAAISHRIKQAGGIEHVAVDEFSALLRQRVQNEQREISPKND